MTDRFAGEGRFAHEDQGSWQCLADEDPVNTTFEYAPGIVFSEDPACVDYDWLVVYDELKGRERLACPRERTILATSEPVSIKHYSRAYVRQFGHLLTNRSDVDGAVNYHLGRGYYKGFCDRTHPEAVSTMIPPKTRTISVVCSSKQMRHTKHFARFRLVADLAKAVPDLEWYGHGVRSFGKKYEVMDPYKYHVVVENHIAPHHWTEKLADAFLCECLLFYAGAPDLADDFPRESFIPIPIDDPAEATRIVNSAVESGEYEKRRTAVLAAKRLVLSRYNFWAQVIEVVKAAESGSATEAFPSLPESGEALRALRDFIRPFRDLLNTLLVGLLPDEKEERCVYSTITLFWTVVIGFHAEKHEGFGLAHTFCNDSKASRNLHIVMEIANALWQVFDMGMLKRLANGKRKVTQEGWAKLLFAVILIVGFYEIGGF